MFRHLRAPLGVLFISVSLWASACSGGSNAPTASPTPVADTPPPISGTGTTPPTPPPGSSELPPIVGSGTAVLVGAGDIGWCGSGGVAQVAKLIEGIAGTVFLAGDLAYMRGTADDFRRCFDPEWGKFRSRWRPVPGNHEYEDAGAAGYFGYFADAAGAGRLGYYGFRAATWHVLMLNSSAPITRGTPQYEWARQELALNRTRCSAAMWHHPFATSGPNGVNGQMRDIWQLLIDNGAEVVVSGHDHLYERFAPQDADYRFDPKGLRQFIAGTGGANLYRAVTRGPNSEAIIEAFGALKLTLEPSGYAWEFLEAATGRVADKGTGTCH